MDHHKKLEAAGYNFVGGTKLGYEHWKDVYRNPTKKDDIVVTHKNGDIKSIYNGSKEHKDIKSALKEENAIMRFKSFFLSEARVSDTLFNKSVEVFKKLLERKFGTKLYRYGGHDGYATFGHYTSILYFYDKHRAISFDKRNGEIETVSLWKNYKLGHPADYLIHIDGANLTGIANKLIDLVQNPKMGTFGYYPELDESLRLDEASRTTPEKFMAMVKAGGYDISKIHRSDLAKVANQHDVLIPSSVQNHKISPAVYDLRTFGTAASDAADGPSDTPAKNNDKQYFIKVTPYDPNTRKFLSAKEDAFAGKLLDRINDTIEKPDFKKEMKDPNTLFGHMRSLVQVLSRGKVKSLLIYGGPGIGKTFVVTKTLQEEGTTYNVVKGKITTASLYQTLYMHREGGVLLFDDTDSVWGDQEAANILKAALDSYDQRMISWYSGRTVNISKSSDSDKEEFYKKLDKMIEDDPSNSKIKYPSEFEYKGQIIFISNLPREKFDEAVLNRSVKIDMTLTQDQLFDRMENILHHLGSQEVDIEAKHEILQFIKGSVKKGDIQTASMRTYVAAESLYLSGVPNWRDLLDYI